MIPRKRLQVLLYIMQIFYVFGDGDPGSEELVVGEVSDNIIDDYSFTTKPPYIHEESRSTNEEKPFNASQEIYSLDYGPKEGESLNSQDNGITANDTDLNHSHDSLTVIESITANDIQATSLNISWTISGDNATAYQVDLYLDGNLIKHNDTTDLYYFIENLEPCSKYKIGVSPLPLLNNSYTKFKNVNTSSSEPGQPVDLDVVPMNSSLKIQWKIPTVAGRCIQKYKIIVDTGDYENRHSDTDNTTETNFVFKNLHACTSYLVTVIPIDLEDKYGKSISYQSKPTLKEATTAPVLNTSDVASISTTKNSATLVWQVMNKANNCTLISILTVCKYNRTEGAGITLVDSNITVSIDNGHIPQNVSITVKKLSPFTSYSCKAQSYNEGGESPWSFPVHIQTTEDTPTPPQNFQKLGRDENSISFIWKAPKYIPGKLQSYRINFTWVPRYPVPDGCKVNRVYVVDNIDPSLTKLKLEKEEAHSHYYARIAARTGAGWSQEDEIQFDSKDDGVPDSVTNLSLTIKRQDNDSNALDTILSWGLPCSLRGDLYKFKISVVGTRPGFENHTITDEVNVTNGFNNNDIFSINFGELRPVYNYVFEVAARLHGYTESGEISNLSFTYPAGIPPQPEMEYVKSITLDPQKARRTTSSAAILLPLFPTDNGEIKYYAIMVSGEPFGNSSEAARFDIKQEKWPNVSSWEEAMEKDFKIPYQATEPLWNPSPNFIVDYGHMKAVKFIVGEDTTCPQVSANTKTRAYCNGPLKPDTWYEVRMRAFTDMGYADSVSFIIKTNDELNLGLVLGVVFGILFIGILTTLMLLVKRCSFRILVQRFLQSNIPESPVPNPFTRRKFISHCQQLAENPGKLSNEFQLLQTLSIDLQMPSNSACLQANRKKNRYSDILPYDFSRVKLEVIDNDPNTDYINASFIKGYSGNEEYIACQGPKEDTTYDFWRMIDQYDVKMIVMLTQLVERGKEKCHQYYPTIRETFNYEKLSIKCTSELDYRNFTQRTLILQKEDKRRTITHLHFKDWPDHDVPDDFDAMIHFSQIFRKQLTTVKGLPVIHCSAGIGRTGTLIAIDILLQSIRDNRKLDVFGTVYRLRRHRLNMVQRESQYAYIYNCISQVLKNPYFSKTYKPPPIDAAYNKAKTKKERSNSNTDLVDSFDTLRKNSLSTSIDSMQPLCQSSPETAPKIQMNGLRYSKSTSAIDTRSNHNRIGRYNSEGYTLCGERDSFSTTSKESTDEIKSSSSSIYENVEPLIRPSSSQTIAGNYYLTNDSVEKDTSL